MKVALLINSSREAEYIVKQIEKVQNICTIIIDMKYKNRKEKILRRILGTSRYYSLKNFFRSLKTVRRFKIYLLERKHRKLVGKSIKNNIKRPFICKDVLYVDNINSCCAVEKLKEILPDFCIVLGTSIIKKQILNMFPSRLINIHFSLLPHYRGSIVEFWQLYNNEPEKIGVTLHLIDSSIDTGPIIAQRETITTSGDNYITARYKNIMCATDLVKDVLMDLAAGKMFKTTNQEIVKNAITYKFSMITDEIKYNYWAKKGEL